MGRYPFLYRLISVFVIISLLVSVFLFSFTRVTADGVVARVPVGPSLTAVLTTDGVLTLEGSGGSDDFTPETAPFAPYVAQIRQVVIPEGVTALGNHLFYGCYGLTGTLVLPSTLVELGDMVFSGPDRDSAPRFTWILNEFTSCEEVVAARPGEYGVAADTVPAAYAVEGDVSAEYTVETRYAQRVGSQVFYPSAEPVGLVLCTMENLSFLHAAMEGGYSLADSEVDLHLIPGDGEGGQVTLAVNDGPTYAPWPGEDLMPPATLPEEPQGLPNGYAAHIVFDGWEDGSGRTYDPGDVVEAEVTLTPKWAWAVVGYMSKLGTAYLSEGMQKLSSYSQDKDDMYRNILVVDRDNVELHGKTGWIGLPSDTYLPELACTVTSLDPVSGTSYQGEARLSLDASYLGGKYTLLSKPAIFHHITLAASHRETMTNVGIDTAFDGLFANCHKLIMGTGIQMKDGSTVNVFGGSGGSSWSFTGQTGGGDLAIFSGDYVRVYGGSFKKQVQKDRSLRFINGTTKLLYGGGYQKDSTTSKNSLVYMFGGTVHQNLVASSDEGVVDGSTTLVMVGGAVGGSVFGGGNQANLTGNTTITILGGTVAGNVYGGGNQAAVTGNTTVTVTGKGQVDGSVYGGGYSSSAVVTGSTTVSIAGGSVGRNVYGGGQQAAVKNDGDIGGSTAVTVSGGTVTGDVFGGGEGLNGDDGIAAVCRSVQVTVEGGTVQGSVFGGGSQGNVGLAGSGVQQVSAAVTISGGTVGKSVFGGGFEGKIGLGTVDDATATANVDVPGSTTVTVSGGEVGEDVFGGGSGTESNLAGATGLGAVFGDSTVSITGGYVGKRVFGGANMARITGNTAVHITSGQGAVEIAQTVYGGGNGQGIYFDENKFLVLGSSSVNVEKTTYDLTIGGSLFGSGNLTRVKGGTEGRRVSIKNLTGTLESLQRADFVTIVDSNLTLTGATDKVDGTTLNFSMAQVAVELRLINSSLTVKTELNEVKGFGSYMDAAGTVEDTSGRNTLTILAGRLLAFGMTDPASKVFTYGHVSGVTTLRWEPDTSLPDADNQGIFVHSDLLSDTGDKEADPTATGAFIADENQNMPADQRLRSGKTDEYSSWHLGGDNVTIRQVLKLTGENVDENGKCYDSVIFRLPTLVLAGTEFSADAPDLSNFALPLTQYGDQVLTLDVEGNAMWGTEEYSIYIVDGEDGKGEIIHREGGRPVTLGQGRPAFIAKMSYKDPKTVPTGVVRVQLRAYEKDDPTLSRGNVTLDLTIEGSGKGTATGHSVAGRRYEPFKTYGTPIIAAGGAVTCQVVLNYTPIGTATDPNGEIPTLTLKDKTSGQTVAAAPHVLMGDFFTPDSPRWYFGDLMDKEGNKGSIRLSDLNNVRGLADWEAPEAGITLADRSLLFILDFRDAPLPKGHYYLALEFPDRGSCVSSGAPFQVETFTDLKGALDWRGTTLAITSPARDVDYTDGALIRLTGLTGETARKVTAAWNGEAVELIAGEEAVFLRLPGLGRGLSTQVTWTFPQVDVDTYVKAELFPLATFQAGVTGHGAPSNQSTYTLRGSGGEVTAQRQLLVELTSPQKESGRLVDSAQGGTLTFQAVLDGGLGEGESVAVTKVARKTADAPEDASYTEEASGWSYTPSVTEPWKGTLTIPAGLTDGTYRVFFQLQKPNGEGKMVPLAVSSYNFIVYTPS